MSIRIIALWDGWTTSSKESELWHFMSRDFEITDVVMIPETGLVHQAITEQTSIQAVIDQARGDGFTVVGLDENGTIELSDYTHPENAAYVFGRGSRNPSIDVDVAVRIATPLTGGLLWGHQAAAIALYDRERKSWP